MALPRAFTEAQGLRDDASIVPYRGLLYRGGCGLPVGRGPAVVRRGGIYPSRGCSRRRRVRRDEGIPPYGHFIGSAYTRKAACFRRGERHVGADSISARFKAARGLRDDASIVPYRGLSYRGGCGFPFGRAPAPNLIPNFSFLIPHYYFVLFSASFARSRTQRVRSSGGRAAGRPHQRQTVASGGKCPRRA